MSRDEKTPVTSSMTIHIHAELAKEAEKHRNRAIGLADMLREHELRLTNVLDSNPRRAAMFRNLRNVVAYYEYRFSRWTLDNTISIERKGREQHEFLALITLVVAALEDS